MPGRGSSNVRTPSPCQVRENPATAKGSPESLTVNATDLGSHDPTVENADAVSQGNVGWAKRFSSEPRVSSTERAAPKRFHLEVN